MEQFVFGQMRRARTRTLLVLDAISEDMIDVVPSGFNNSIRWQIGHILTVQERYVSQITGQPMDLPEEYVKFFDNGTKPANWDSPPPELNVLKDQLREQTERLISKLSGSLANKLPEPIRGMETFGDIAINTTFHEGMHIGEIGGLRRTINASKQ